MWCRYRFLLLLLAASFLAEGVALAQSRTSKRKPNRARSGAYARYDRSGRRLEEDSRLAPGMRINMPSPPTTDYMGRPLKKKVAKPATTNSTLAAGRAAPAAAPKPAATPARRRK
ncbi:hypothetical protein SAMN02745146_3097 [Hymenobacter daecheongensis DSM 21074]|uniref:Uncharacterized protein n=1 Tax=Hymenobacter daecheongensis DSM 21074 TaxID=1121955 RepID=A0A1M6J4P9_9BACT|nr:hypothetical protein [Hymenobacter daecheongensis]SHJ41690.1 hypothetical protein SAMN02745146_3097 [Hymenobacter daecheongensis DSM 21074]